MLAATLSTGMLGRVARLMLRRRWPLLAALGAISAWLSPAEPVDMTYFSTPGGHLLTGHFARVYDQPGNQGGPLQLIGSRLSMTVSHQNGPLGFVFAIDPWAVGIVNVVLVLLAMRACRAAGGPDPHAVARRELLVGATVVLWLTPVGLWFGHPFEIMIPLCWIAGVKLLRRDRPLAAAALFGLSVAVAPWAVLGFPCVLAAKRVTVGLGTAAAAGVIACLEYLPFVLSGHFQMFHMRWLVNHATLIHALFPDAVTVGWGLRVGQAAVIALGCAYVAWRYRSHPLIAALAPLTALLLRVATDPLLTDYYWVPVGVAVIALATMAPDDETWKLMRPRILLLLYLPWTALSMDSTPTIVLVCLLLTASVLARPHRLIRRPLTRKNRWRLRPAEVAPIGR